MSISQEFVSTTKQQLSNAYGSLLLIASNVYVNGFNRQPFVVYADDPFGKQMAKAMQSALPAPEVTGNLAVDTALQTGLSVAGLEAVRTTSSKANIIATALGAQALSCLADSGVEQLGVLSGGQKYEENVGLSAIYVAWFSKFILDKAYQARQVGQEDRSRKYLLGGALFAAAMSAGVYLAFDKLAGTAHAAGISVGVASHFQGRQRLEQLAANNAAA